VCSHSGATSTPPATRSLSSSGVSALPALAMEVEPGSRAKRVW
jgi:hypothetical protein